MVTRSTTHEPPDGYYDNTRPEVVALVPERARFVVDVGCAAGGLGRALKLQRPGVEVRGIEPVQSQADKARRVLDDVHVGNADGPLPDHWPAPDCVIFADVLEHLLDPWQTVAAFRRVLRPGGALVASIPNVAHRSVLRGLARHRWDYGPEGILDRTHLRFFTRETALEMFEKAGFSIAHVGRVVEGLGTKPVGRWIRSVIDRESRRERLYPQPAAFVIDSITIQFLIVAT
jgi:2-polyprenyl-3-methyl-5-hydroxy-6-metoxy-1,4-benzoquinol methylase